MDERRYTVKVNTGNNKLRIFMTRYANENIHLHSFKSLNFDSVIGPTTMIYMDVPQKVAITARLLGAEVTEEG